VRVTMSDEKMPRRRLARHDSSSFTLHEHCGRLSSNMRECLQRHGMVDFDPVRLQEEGWGRAKECRKAWEEYRTCGRRFFDAVDGAHAECDSHTQAYRQCAARPGSDCEALELALWQCTSTSLKRRMSGQPPPDLSD
jgi:hypothetical protein